jgi:hypothetical protein
MSLDGVHPVQSDFQYRLHVALTGFSQPLRLAACLFIFGPRKPNQKATYKTHNNQTDQVSAHLSLYSPISLAARTRIAKQPRSTRHAALPQSSAQHIALIPASAQHIVTVEDIYQQQSETGFPDLDDGDGVQLSKKGQ